MKRRTRITVKCVADRFVTPERERVVEFMDPATNLGGLISFYRREDGRLQINLYELDPGIVVGDVGFKGGRA